MSEKGNVRLLESLKGRTIVDIVYKPMWPDVPTLVLDDGRRIEFSGNYDGTVSYEEVKP